MKSRARRPERQTSGSTRRSSGDLVKVKSVVIGVSGLAVAGLVVGAALLLTSGRQPLPEQIKHGTTPDHSGPKIALEHPAVPAPEGDHPLPGAADVPTGEESSGGAAVGSFGGAAEQVAGEDGSGIFVPGADPDAPFAAWNGTIASDGSAIDPARGEVTAQYVQPFAGNLADIRQSNGGSGEAEGSGEMQAQRVPQSSLTAVSPDGRSKSSPSSPREVSTSSRTSAAARR